MLRSYYNFCIFLYDTWVEATTIVALTWIQALEGNEQNIEAGMSAFPLPSPPPGNIQGFQSDW